MYVPETAAALEVLNQADHTLNRRNDDQGADKEPTPMRLPNGEPVNQQKCQRVAGDSPEVVPGLVRGYGNRSPVQVG